MNVLKATTAHPALQHLLRAQQVPGRTALVLKGKRTVSLALEDITAQTLASLSRQALAMLVTIAVEMHLCPTLRTVA